MSWVYKAFDPILKRYVALKILKTSDPVLIQRFFREAHAQARFEHDNICKIYEMGEIHGTPFIAMQLIEGQPLDKAAIEMTLEQKVLVMKEIAETVHAAHSCGLVHRDIKPSNILVKITEKGDYKPYILDFGLVKEQESPKLTHHGLIVGTPAFMAPEQASGEVQNIDRRTDVYSLGAAFYAILSGQAPYQGNTQEILGQIKNKDPVPLRKINPKLPIDIETIVQKCLEKEIVRRYPSARALAEDLHRYLAGEPIQARRTHKIYRLMKKLRKNKGWLASLIIISMISLGFLTFFIWHQWEAGRQARLADEFSQEIKNIENMLWYMYYSPLHDIRPEKEAIKEKIGQIARRMQQEGKLAFGPGHYALGRGYLALGEYEQAQKNLELAWEKYKYRLPHISYSLGITLTMLHKRELIQAEMFEPEQIRELKKKKSETLYLARALELISKGKKAAPEPWEYVEALIDYLTQKNDLALEKLNLLSERMPWFYEARLLRGSIFVHIGNEKRSKGDLEGAFFYYQKARNEYLSVLDKIESNPEIYRSIAEIEMQEMTAKIFLAELSPQESFNRAQKAIEDAFIAEPFSPETLNLKSLLHWRWAEYQLYKGEAPLDSLKTSIEAAQEALKIDPKNSTSYENLGSSYLILGAYEKSVGQNSLPSFLQAIDYFQKTVDINPRDIIALNNLGLTYWNLGLYEKSTGRKAKDSFLKGIRVIEKAIEIDPQNSFSYNTLGNLWLDLAHYEISINANPINSIQKAIGVYGKAVKINPSYFIAINNLGESYLLKAEYEFQHALSPEDSLHQAGYWSDLSLKIKPDFFWANLTRGRIYTAMAEWIWKNGKSPQIYFAKARHVLERGIKINPKNAETFLAMGKNYRLWADWLSQNKSYFEETLQQAENYLEKALRIDSTLAEAWAEKAVLFVLKAKTASQKSVQDHLLAEAKKYFEQAFSLNPWLKSNYQQLPF